MNGLIGFLVVVALFGAALLLFLSMTRHLRKVPKTFDPPGPDDPPASSPPADPPSAP